jgi:hypothetical protein
MVRSLAVWLLSKRYTFTLHDQDWINYEERTGLVPEVEVQQA